MSNFLTPENEADYRKAGKIAAEALQYGLSLIKPGESMREVLDKIEQFILDKGAAPAFPAQSCVNDVAAHYCPTEKDDIIYKETDVVKLDVGVHVNGFIGDNAQTLSLDGKHQDLCDAARDAVETVEKMLKAGITPHEIGQTVQDTLAKHGFVPIRNLTGHGVGQYNVHCKPSIPNYPNNDMTPLEENMVIAIEPFATNGEGMIFNSTNPTVMSLRGVKPVRSPHGRATLELLQTFQGLPFTTRWITGALGGKGLLGLAELKRMGLLEEYPPLPEKASGLVAQHEYTFLIKKDGCERLTKV
ncbi:MAG: type II methionyl aminopeptidase [Candidatus Woesearchaeota archaeon]|nr:type II methionyl aminopeptidase [Candidatus Woesearchaeota archaeon]